MKISKKYIVALFISIFVATSIIAQINNKDLFQLVETETFFPNWEEVNNQNIDWYFNSS